MARHAKGHYECCALQRGVALQGAAKQESYNFLLRGVRICCAPQVTSDRHSRLTTLMVLFITYVHIPVGIKLPQKKQTDGLRRHARVLKCELRAGSIAAGEWAQSDGMWGPQG